MRITKYSNISRKYNRYIKSKKIKTSNTKIFENNDISRSLSRYTDMYQDNILYKDITKNIIIYMKKLFVSTNHEDFKTYLEEIYTILKIPQIEFQNILKLIVPFAKIGHSGAKIGINKYYKNQVIKIFTSKQQDINKAINYDKCIKISNNFNEIFINLLLSNINSIIHMKKNEILLIKKHILPILNCGISSDGTFIVIPLIGLSVRISEVHHKITNLRELLYLNHLELLRKAITEKRVDILSNYDKFITDKIGSYLLAIKILQKYLNFIHTDVKLTNIFIKKISKPTNKYNILEKNGFIINFECIISDLEKTNIQIGKYKITTIPNNPLKVKLLTTIGKGLIYDVRYTCNRNIKSCSYISIMDFDILCLVIDLLVQLLQVDNDFMMYLPHFSEMIQKIIKPNLYNKLLEILKKGNYKIDKNYSYLIGNIIIKLCKKF